MKEQLEAIAKKAFEELAQSQDLKALDAVRVKYLGKKGELTAILKQMGKLSAEERPVIGQLANQVRGDIEEKLEQTSTCVWLPKRWTLPCRAKRMSSAKDIR